MRASERIARAWRALWSDAPISAPSIAVQAPAERAFAAGEISRLTASIARWSGSLNADLDGALVPMRASARQLAANAAFGRRLLTLVAANVIGPGGPKLQVRAYTNTTLKAPLDKPANVAIQDAWRRWCRACDVSAKMDFARLQAVAIKAVARDGEVLIEMVRDSSLPGGLGLRLLDADRLEERYNVSAQPGRNAVRQGVELDALGRPLAYWINSVHPGDDYATRSSARLRRVPAESVRHVFLPERSEQVRGYTWFHAVLNRSHMLDGFEEAAVVAARVGAQKVGVWQQAPDAAAGALATQGVQVGADGALVQPGEPGEFVVAPPGYTLGNWSPDYPHQNFDGFVKACWYSIAAGLDVAAHNLTGDLSAVNYSSARVGELAERDVWKTLQGWWIHAVCMPVFAEWLMLALLRGDIRFPSGAALKPSTYDKFFAASTFLGRRWAWVDPAKEAAAAQQAIDSRLASRTRLAAEQGEDWEEIVDEIAAEEAYMEAADVEVDPARPEAPEPADAGETDATDTAAETDTEDAAARARVASLEAALAQTREEIARLAGLLEGVRAVPPQVHVTVPETQIHMDAHIAAPEVRVEQPITVAAPPAQVTIAQPRRTVETIERDEHREIARVVREVAE